jgi:hypothetical protein
MRDRDDLDEILKRAAATPANVDPVLLDRISRSIASGLQPSRPLPSWWVLIGGLVLVSAVGAVLVAALLKPYGFQRMTAMEMGLILPVLGFLMLISAALSVADAIPGSRRLMSPWLLLATCCVAIAGVIGFLFHDYGTEEFVIQGVKCLGLGLMTALPAYLGIWWLLKRGFTMDVVSAGLARGTVAGLAGIAMLQLHCPNFEAPHIIVWHIAVVPVTAAIAILVLAMQADRG